MDNDAAIKALVDVAANLAEYADQEQEMAANHRTKAGRHQQSAMKARDEIASIEKSVELLKSAQREGGQTAAALEDVEGCEAGDYRQMPITRFSGAALDVLGQLFVFGPTWDGNLVSKSGRDELVRAGLAECWNGWQWLTAAGAKFATWVDVKHRADQRWYLKQQCR